MNACAVKAVLLRKGENEILLVLSSFTSDLAEILSSKYPQEFTE
jgi:hypothetical protein